jgi:hypothetical protein
VAICQSTDYNQGTSILRHNAAVETMRELVSEPHAVQDLFPLLNEPQCAGWLAFQLLELTDLAPNVAEHCLAIISALAKGNDGDALGARMWLDEWRESGAKSRS